MKTFCVLQNIRVLILNGKITKIFITLTGEKLMDIWEKNKRNAEIMCEFYYREFYLKFANHYVPYFTRHNNGFYNKNINTFIKISEMFGPRDGFEPKKFISCVSLEEGKLKYPNQLLNKFTWDLYIRNKEFYKEKTVKNLQKQIAQNVVEFFSSIGNKTISDWMKNIMVKNRLLNGDKSDYWVLSFSKSFLIFRDENFINMNIDFKRDYQDKLTNKKIKLKLQEKLGDDFIEL